MKETPTIEINMDKACLDCGKMGACQNGLCLSCITKRIEIKNFSACKEHLKCVLTEKEIKECGLSLALANSSVTDLDAQKKKFNDQIKADISGHEATISKMASMIQNGYEYRQVECAIEKDFDSKVIRIIRLDTGEVVRETTMTADELQEKLFKEGLND
ncbi:MAG: hypothetical protein ABIL06_16190 [Pseudomonadota bacterium]